MREFLYYSKHARTTGNFDLTDLMKAGRMDIACQIAIMSFFLSHDIREDVKLHLIFDGGPDPPKHLEMFPGKNIKENGEKIQISKKDVASLIKKMLYKYKPGIKNEFVAGYSTEKKSFEKVIEDLAEEGKEIYLMDDNGQDIRTLKDKEIKNAVFIIGDQDGLPKDKLKGLKRAGIKKISIGNKTYFASQVVTIIQNELDRRES
jgi:tRNA (pseudouridine54-N1)-methyltransferase